MKKNRYAAIKNSWSESKKEIAKASLLKTTNLQKEDCDSTFSQKEEKNISKVRIVLYARGLSLVDTSRFLTMVFYAFLRW